MPMRIFVYNTGSRVRRHQKSYALQHAANTLQLAAVACSKQYNTLQHTATHLSTPQHTATNCNWLCCPNVQFSEAPRQLRKQSFKTSFARHLMTQCWFLIAVDITRRMSTEIGCFLLHTSTSVLGLVILCHIDWWLLLLLKTVIWYPCLMVYVAQIHVDLSSLSFWVFAGIEPTTSGLTVPRSDQQS